MDESGDELQYPEVPGESAAAPFFEMKLKHYKIFEGMPVTFTCRVAGNPKPKVSERRGFFKHCCKKIPEQRMRKNSLVVPLLHQK